MASNAINPSHYQGFSNGAQVIDIKENLYPNAGDAVKYLARSSHLDPALHKGQDEQDLTKAFWYVGRELKRRFGNDALVAAISELPQDDAPLEDDATAKYLKTLETPRTWNHLVDVPLGVVVDARDPDKSQSDRLIRLFGGYTYDSWASKELVETPGAWDNRDREAHIVYTEVLD